jgi:hypothetical protein
MDKYNPEVLAKAKQMFEKQKALQLHKILENTDHKLIYRSFNEPLLGIYSMAKLSKDIEKDIAKKITPITKAFFKKSSPTFTAFQFQKGNYCMELPLKGRYYLILNLTQISQRDIGGELLFQDKRGEVIEVPNTYNSLAIIDAKGLRGFVTYLNHYAKYKKTLYLAAL